MARDLSWAFGGRRPRYRLPRPRARYIVFCRSETLPVLLDIANPDRHRGAVQGLPVPVDRKAHAMADLERALTCGRYAFADDAGTLISATVHRRREAECPKSSHRCGRQCHCVSIAGAAAGSNYVAFLTLKKPSGDIHKSVKFQSDLAERLASMTDGFVFDLDACRKYVPGQEGAGGELAQVDGLRYVSYHSQPLSTSRLWLHSHGLIKFGRPELEILDVPPDRRTDASMVLFYLSQGVLDGSVLKPGDSVGPAAWPFNVQRGRNPGNHYDVPVLEVCWPGAPRPEGFVMAASALREWFHERYDSGSGGEAGSGV